MAVKGKIEVQDCYKETMPPRTTTAHYSIWSGCIWRIDVYGHPGTVSCTVVSPRPYEEWRTALAAAKRQANRLGIDVSEQ